MITPTQDGVLIDCGGDFRTWGCGCEHCLPRRHPLDLIARVSKIQLAEWAAVSYKLNTRPRNRGICYCGSPGRLYAGGFRCEKHVHGHAGLLMEATREAIGSYVREHGTSPWPHEKKEGAV